MADFAQGLLVALRLIIGLATGIAILHFGLLVAIRWANRHQQPGDANPRPQRYVFMVPALNEELVIADTVRRLLALPGDIAVLVIDDGSDDATATIVTAMAESDPRISLLRRTAPNARQGKGEALNAGYRLLRDEILAAGGDPGAVILCVMDADGLIDQTAISAVSKHFADDDVGAVQIGVRIINRQSLTARLQDIEFFTFVNVVQQGRNHIGSVGLGGNGQFTRLAALMTLGDAPWTDCLTEDLDLGLQLVVSGWRLAFTDGAHVHQQGLTHLGRLVRQRSRWAQGYFQCWRRIPDVLASNLPWYATADILYALLWPVVSCLLFPVAIVLSWLLLLVQMEHSSLTLQNWLLIFTISYVLSFSTAAILAFSYRARSRDISVPQTIALYHLIGLYQFVWAAAGWRAVRQMMLGQRGWAKTERSTPVLPPPASSPK